METVVRLEGAVEALLKRLIELGYFKTKNEAIRAGILELAREYKVFKTPEELEDEFAVAKMQKVDEEVRAGKRKLLTMDEMKKKYKGVF
jgi:Arc/MetJ-type ribon-helix-helix transcriptional regulator